MSLKKILWIRTLIQATTGAINSRTSEALSFVIGDNAFRKHKKVMAPDMPHLGGKSDFERVVG